MGDVILSLPALRALRERFPGARLTAMTGKSAAAIADIAGVFDDKITVDRVALRDGNKLDSIRGIGRLVREVRRRRFDFVIDLHSLSETNLLGFLSGAPHRLYSHRENRSLDFLGRFAPRPPREDKSKHIAERYTDVLAPLGITSVDRFAPFAPRAENLAGVEQFFREKGIPTDGAVGLFPGAGHPSRRWSLANFAQLAARLIDERNAGVLVFLGPEEAELIDEIRAALPEAAHVVHGLGLLDFFAAVARVRVFVSNDTGPMHLAALAGAPVVLVLDKRAPETFLPLTDKLRVVKSGEIDRISVGEVFQATTAFLGNELTGQ